MSSQVQVLAQSEDTRELGEFDVFIAFDCGDHRCLHISKSAAPLASRRWMMGVVPHPDSSSARLRQKLALEEIEWPDVPENFLAVRLAACGSPKRLSVFLDVSAFPRTKLAAIMQGLRAEAANREQGVNVTMGYCLAAYAPPSQGDVPPNCRVEPVHPEFAGWPRSPGLPVALTVGLGYERGKALGAVEYIQPASLRLFVPHSPEVRYLADVQSINQDLMAAAEVFNCFNYAVLDPASQLGMLRSMLSGLAVGNKLVVLPFGPKILFATTLLAAMEIPEVAVWHVSGEEQQAPSARRASRHAVYFTVNVSAMKRVATSDEARIDP